MIPLLAQNIGHPQTFLRTMSFCRFCYFDSQKKPHCPQLARKKRGHTNNATKHEQAVNKAKRCLVCIKVIGWFESRTRLFSCLGVNPHPRDNYDLERSTRLLWEVSLLSSCSQFRKSLQLLLWPPEEVFSDRVSRMEWRDAFEVKRCVSGACIS